MQDLNDKVTGGTLTAAEWNEVPGEIQNVIEGTGQTLSGGDLNQLGKGLADYVANGNFYTDSGAADAYVLTGIGSKQSLTAYTDGAAFEFVAGNVNTGASTINVAALGVKNIKLADGSDPVAGDITGRTTCRFDAGNNRFELINPALSNDRIGINQTWQSVTRTSAVLYTNTTGKPITLLVSIITTGNNVTGICSIVIDASPSMQLARAGGSAVNQTASTGTVVIPDGASYTLTNSGITRNTWELR